VLGVGPDAPAASASMILHDTILDAGDRGTLCICAAGNYGGPVRYPAAFAECVAVGVDIVRNL
jgi:subtilisin